MPRRKRQRAVQLGDKPATPKRYLISPELAEGFDAMRDAFELLHSVPFIDHGPRGGHAWLMERTEAHPGDGYGRRMIQEVELAPGAEWHIALCFECSGVAPPPGWSQEERRARAAEPIPDLPLRPGIGGAAGFYRSSAKRRAIHDSIRAGELMTGER